eukprot:5386950-Prymnesium_polylepis.1
MAGTPLNPLAFARARAIVASVGPNVTIHDDLHAFVEHVRALRARGRGGERAEHCARARERETRTRAQRGECI